MRCCAGVVVKLVRDWQLNWRYGIGQLTIVVAGVLIALAADGWRQDLRDRATELEYIQRLIGDLTSDVAAISNSMMLTEDRAEYGQIVLQTYDTGRRSADAAEFVRAVEYADFFSYPIYARTTIEDLATTGNLRLIRSTAVRQAMSQYYGQIDWIEQFSSINRDTQTALFRYVSDFIELDIRYSLLMDSMSTSCGPTLTCDQGIPWAPPALVVSDAEADLVLDKLLASPEARPLYAGMARIQGGHYANLASIRKLAQQALEMLDRYTEEGW